MFLRANNSLFTSNKLFIFNKNKFIFILLILLLFSLVAKVNSNDLIYLMFYT